MGTDSTRPENSQGEADPTELLFSEPMAETEAIPAPQLFMDMILRQWVSLGAYSNHTLFDRKFYNVTPDLTELLQTPEVDEPVMTLASPSATLTDAEDVLKPQQKKVELTLCKAASFFTRALLL